MCVDLCRYSAYSERNPIFLLQHARQHGHALLGEANGGVRRPPQLDITDCDLRFVASSRVSWNMSTSRDPSASLLLLFRYHLAQRHLQAAEGDTLLLQPHVGAKPVCSKVQVQRCFGGGQPGQILVATVGFVDP